MAGRYPKLDEAIASRAVGWTREHGIEFERKANGDGVFWIGAMVDGHRIHRVQGSLREGVTPTKVGRILEMLRADAREQRFSLPSGRKTTMGFREAAEKYLRRLADEGGKDLKAKHRRLVLHLVPFFGAARLPSIDAGDVERYKRARLNEIAFRGTERNKPKDVSNLQTTRPGTVNRELAALSHLLHKAVEWGWIKYLPTKISLLKDDARRIDYLTVDQCNRLLDVAKLDENEQIHPFIFIGLQSAMREMEILRIRRDDIDVEGRTIFIRQAKAGPRLQPITQALAKFLAGYVEKMPADQAWLFRSSSASGHTMGVRKAFRRVVSVARLDPDKFTPHTLRHTACTHIVHAGVDLPTAAQFTGHKTLAMLLRYVHASTPHIQGAVDKLEARYRAADRPNKHSCESPPPPTYSTPNEVRVARLPNRVGVRLLPSLMTAAGRVKGRTPLRTFAPSRIGITPELHGRGNLRITRRASL